MIHRKLKYIWVTSESDLNEMFESNLSKRKMKQDEMHFNVMMHRWNQNTSESHLSQILNKMSESDLNKIWVRFKLNWNDKDWI